MSKVPVSYLVVDWGSTNFRAFAMDRADQLLDSKEAPIGLLQIKDGNFAQTLQDLLAAWLTEYQHLPIFMAGMIGSLKGWVNVDYAATPTSTSALVKKAHSFALPWGPKATILPGVCHNYEADNYDVMRGEEVQIFGLAKLVKTNKFNAILPGTHSKHATYVDGQITAFASFLTGEFYSVLSNHSLLGKALPENPPQDDQAFLKGVLDGQTGQLTNRIFLAWTNRLFKNLTEAQIPDYLSGLLIGHELKALTSKQVYLVGGSSLCARYALACKELQIQSETVSGNQCFLAGIIDLVSELKLQN
ncbi:2-dehydro-3-deoxygalactonokinase [Paraglaciecola aquimarina]|uniref:2-dehydro-3-deoxygalactonokinase n=1 Tax=Paraglaciecola algarum TaxID=3050085 RepID=A0ABS9D4T1_9ALTE|nr:2-dehydro-3-deoxygalactonokinase [Paraglaciecola sp. G1-23]MCF2947953.1 2-dehydro-3-deoxygalactonokinase [Paraglaciecola sp. G1-23]